MIPVVAIDFETSGLCPCRHAPVQIGIVADLGSREVTYSSIIAPDRHNKTGRVMREYDACALQVSGLTWVQIDGGVAAKTVVAQIEEFASEHGLRSATVLAFNAPFDFRFWSELLYIAGEWRDGSFRPARSPFLGGWVCVRLRAQRALPNLPDHRLDTVAAHFWLERSSGSHDALEDARLALELYRRLS